MTEAHWKFPEGGAHFVAIHSRIYEALQNEVDNFFGRPLAKYSHYLTWESNTYAVFSFKEKEEALQFMTAFEGEPFDPRDAGRGAHWMKWFRGRVSGRKRDGYNFNR